MLATYTLWTEDPVNQLLLAGLLGHDISMDDINEQLCMLYPRSAHVRGCDDYEFRRPPAATTDALPGSPAKVAVMRARQAAGEGLWKHPGDAEFAHAPAQAIVTLRDGGKGTRGPLIDETAADE